MRAQSSPAGTGNECRQQAGFRGAAEQHSGLVRGASHPCLLQLRGHTHGPDALWEARRSIAHAPGGRVK